MVPPPKKVFSDFLAGLPTGNVPTPADPPAPDDLVSRAIQALARGSTKVAKGIQEAGTAQKDAWKKFLSNPTAENSVDIAGDLIAPMALSTRASQFAGSFTDNLYSRLSASITNGPTKATGKKWLEHFMKGTNKGEVDYAGLKQMLEADPSKVFTKDEITNQYFKDPLLYNVDEFPTDDYKGWWPKVPGVNVDLNTYKMNNITARPPRMKSTQDLLDLQNKEIQRRSEASKNALGPTEASYWQDMLARSIEQYNYLARQPDLEFATSHSPIPNTIAHSRLAQGEYQGRPITVIGEIQSDVHQPRSKIPAYLDREGKPRPEIIEALAQERDRALKALQDFRASGQNDTQAGYQVARAFDDAEHDFLKYSQGSFTPADLPFKSMSDWAELGLKNALFHAAKANSEGLVIPTGQAVSDVVGMPKGGQKFYDEDLPNKLAKYIKNQLGADVAPQQILGQPVGGPPTLHDLLRVIQPMRDGPNMFSIPDLPGPMPEGYVDFLANFPTSIRRVTPDLIEEKLSQAKYQNIGVPKPTQVQADAFRTDISTLANNFTTPVIQPRHGTFIPLPQEARDKILSDGQRLWMALAAAGIPTFMQTQKKNDSKRSKSNGS